VTAGELPSLVVDGMHEGADCPPSRGDSVRSTETRMIVRYTLDCYWTRRTFRARTSATIER